MRAIATLSSTRSIERIKALSPCFRSGRPGRPRPPAESVTHDTGRKKNLSRRKAGEKHQGFNRTLDVTSGNL